MTAIYLIDRGSLLTAQRQVFQVFHQQELRARIPASQTSYIIVFNNCRLDNKAASLAIACDIPVLYLGNAGQYLGRLEPESPKAVKYLPHQIKRASDRAFVRTTAETILRAKLHNCCALLLQLTDSHYMPFSDIALEVITLLIDDLPLAKSLDALQEIDAIASTFYERSLRSLLASAFYHPQHHYHQNIAPINTILRLSYALLNHTIYGFVCSHGLHPKMGNLYLENNDELPLVSDLSAEWMAAIGERLAAELIYSQILTPHDFAPANGCKETPLYPHTIKTFLEYWEKKLQTQVIRPNAATASYRQCIDLQVQEYVAYLLGDIDSYQPTLVKLNANPLPALPNIQTQRDRVFDAKVGSLR